jgi:hypothetical protein
MTIVFGIMLFISSVTPLPEMVTLNVITPLNSLAEAIKDDKTKTVTNNQLIDKYFFIVVDLFCK